MVRLASLPVFALSAISLGEIVDANFAAQQKDSSVPSTEKKGSASQGSGDSINYNYLMSPGGDWSQYANPFMGGGSKKRSTGGSLSGGSPLPHTYTHTTTTATTTTTTATATATATTTAAITDKYTGGGIKNASKSGGQGGGYQQYEDQYGDIKYTGWIPGGSYSKYMGWMGPPGGKAGGSPGGDYSKYIVGSSPPGGPSQRGYGGDGWSRYTGGFMGGGAGPKVGASATSPIAAEEEGSDKGAAAATRLAESDRDAEGRHTNLTVVALSFVAFGWMGLVTFARQRERSAITDALLQSEVVGARGLMYLEA